VKVVIVDDEPAGRRSIRECCELEADLTIIGEYGDGLTALEAMKRQPPDLLFLDIQMDSLTGLDVARALDPEMLPLIVFVTAYDNYAIKAFEVNAIDYLLKPFDEDRFRATLARVRRRRVSAGGASDQQAALLTLLATLERGTRVAAPPASRLLAESGGRMRMLDVADIEVMESDRNYVILRVGRDSFHARSTLQQAEETLQTQPMIRISRSCVVNVSHIREVSRTPRGDFILVMAGGTTVTSSEGFRESVRARLDRLKMGGAAPSRDG
jgi:two-component system, LytTR family, response regulator